MLGKNYGDAPGEGRYSPGECIGIQQRRAEGRPDPAHISTNYAERANLSLRMGSGRFTRREMLFQRRSRTMRTRSRSHTMHYNFVRIYQTLRCPGDGCWRDPGALGPRGYGRSAGRMGDSAEMTRFGRSAWHGA